MYILSSCFLYIINNDGGLYFIANLLISVTSLIVIVIDVDVDYVDDNDDNDNDDNDDVNDDDVNDDDVNDTLTITQSYYYYIYTY